MSFFQSNSFIGLFSVVALSSIVACGSDSQPPPSFNFDRPSEIVFSCYGDLNVNGSVLSSAQPVSSCTQHADGTPPAGQENVEAPDLYGFVLQPSRGTLAVINLPAFGVVDNDTLTPGLNDIPVGSLPVGLVPDQSGCFVTTANAGSCDLSLIDVSSALDAKRSAIVNRVNVTAPNGDTLLVKPRSIAVGPQVEEIGLQCPDSATGLVYVSYPACKLVAAIEPATGSVVSGVVFRDDGTVEVAVDADFAACPTQCGDSVTTTAAFGGGGPDAGPDPVETFDEKPVRVQVAPDGSVLYIAGQTSPFFTIVDLGADGKPTGTSKRIRVQGDVGILNFAVTDRIDMGGDEISTPRIDPIGEFQFAYLITTDSTIRVLDLDHEQECDTQVDPRFLAGETDVEFLSCMPVGDPRTAERRVGARSPGIHLPENPIFGAGSGQGVEGRIGYANLALPLDISFATLPSLEGQASEPHPNDMTGTFAFVTTASGFVFVINVDDDNYADTESPISPALVSMPLAIAHQLRDNVVLRGNEAEATSCGLPAGNISRLGARLLNAPGQIIRTKEIAEAKAHELPFFQGQLCETSPNEEGEVTQTVVTELAFAADVQTRESAFPDVRLVENQEWSVSWEGALSNDGLTVAIDGPQVRKGILKREGSRLLVEDLSGPFCNLGVEEFDILSVEGCDPIRGDAQCGLGETCYVHPDSTGAISSGVCVNKDKVDALSGTCRDFFISKRRYTVTKSSQHELELVERRRVLKTSPLDGCSSSAQCEEFYLKEPLLAIADHPIDIDLDDPDPAYSWVCEEDPSRAPGVNRCVMSCQSTSDCEDAFHCSSGRCVEAPLPPEDCLLSAQRYQAKAGEAFVVSGSDDGYIHSTIADESTGVCIQDPNASVLVTGRIPLRAPACDTDDDFTTGPNPCSVTTDNVQRYVPFVVEGDRCVAQDIEFRTRQVPAIRFSNPALTFHLANTETRGDLNCINDNGGTGPAFATVFEGYQIGFSIVGGFSPKRVEGLRGALPIRSVRGPEGKIWVLDQGDVNSFTNGRVFRFDPTKSGASDGGGNSNFALRTLF